MELTVLHHKTYISEASDEEFHKLRKSLKIWFTDFRGQLQGISLLKGEEKSFPTGYLETALEKVKKRGVNDIRLVDKRVYPRPQYSFNKKNSFPPLWEHQLLMMEATDKNPIGGLSSLMGCHEKGTKILMFDGHFKNVEEIVPGDLLMGPDSTPRKVLSLYRGREKMYRIIPKKGKPFVVNQSHILSLKKTPNKAGDVHTIENISVKNFIANIPKSIKSQYMLYQCGVDFANSTKLPLDPYILGTWLGDKTSRDPEITSMDVEVVTAWQQYATENRVILTKSASHGKCARYHITLPIEQRGRSKNNCFSKNPLTNALQALNLLNNKHIPFVYQTASRKDRLEILAGLLDTDGNYDLRGNVFDFINKNENITNGLVFIARSLGFYCSIQECKKTCKTNKGTFGGKYFRVCISGNLDIIPTKIKRKQARKRSDFKNHLVSSFSLQELPEDDFYGFELTGDHLYLLEDFTVTHNTGKSRAIFEIFLQKRVKTLILVPTTTIQKQLYKDFCEGIGSKFVSMKTPKFFGQNQEIEEPAAKTLGSSYLQDLGQQQTGTKAPGSSYLSDRVSQENAAQKRIGSSYLSDFNEGKNFESPEESYLKRRKGLNKGNSKWSDKFLNKKYNFAPKKANKEFPVTILCYKALDEIPQAFLDSVQCVLIDEYHHASSQTIRDALLNMPNAAYRYGFSATPWRDHYHEKLLLYSTLGHKLIFEMLPEEAIEKGLVAKPNRRVIYAPTPDDFLRDMRNWRMILENGIIANSARNKSIVRIAQEHMENKRNVLICVDEIAHLDILKQRFEEKKINPLIIHGQMDGEIKDANVEEVSFSAGGIISIATMAVGEGANLVNVDVIILASGGKGSIRFLQRIGRGMRKTENKSTMIVIDFEDWFNPILAKHSRIRDRLWKEIFGQ